MDPSERASETADVWVILPTSKALRVCLRLPRSVPPSRGSDFEVQKQILILLLHLPPSLGSAPSFGAAGEVLGGIQTTSSALFHF